MALRGNARRMFFFNAKLLIAKRSELEAENRSPLLALRTPFLLQNTSRPSNPLFCTFRFALSALQRLFASCPLATQRTMHRDVFQERAAQAFIINAGGAGLQNRAGRL